MRGIFMRPAGGLRAGWRYVSFVLVLLLARLVLSLVVALLDLPPLRVHKSFVLPGSLLVRGLLGFALTLGVTAAFCRLLDRRPLSSVGLPLCGPWGKGIVAGFLLGAAPIALLVALLAAMGRASIAASVLTLDGFVHGWLPMSVGLVFVSSQEELLLRGYGLQTLADGGGRWLAAVFTGALFGLMHAGNPGATALGIVNTAVNAVLLAWLVMLTGSLWIACAYHAGWNLTGAMVFGMRLSGLDHVPGLLAIRLTGPDWVSGGSYGFEGSALVGPLELVVLGLALAFASRLPRHPELLRQFGDRAFPKTASAGSQVA